MGGKNQRLKQRERLKMISKYSYLCLERSNLPRTHQYDSFNKPEKVRNTHVVHDKNDKDGIISTTTGSIRECDVCAAQQSKGFRSQTLLVGHQFQPGLGIPFLLSHRQVRSFLEGHDLQIDPTNADVTNH